MCSLLCLCWELQPDWSQELIGIISYPLKCKYSFIARIPTVVYIRHWSCLEYSRQVVDLYSIDISLPEQ